MSQPDDIPSIGQLAQPITDQAQRAGQTPPAQSSYPNNFGKFVRQGATYTHVIRLADTRKTTLIGYSRPRGGREKDDKVVLLQDIIRRLLASPKAYLQGGPASSSTTTAPMMTATHSGSLPSTTAWPSPATTPVNCPG